MGQLSKTVEPWPWSLTLWANTHSRLIWIWVSPSISWKSLLYQRCWRSGQSGQLTRRWRHGFVFTLHRVGLSPCESLEHWYTSIFHPCTHTKNIGQPDEFNGRSFYNIISHPEKVVPKDTQDYMIDLRFTCLWIHFWKWNCYVLNAGPWATVLHSEHWLPDADGRTMVSREQCASFRESDHLCTSRNEESRIFFYSLNTQG